MCLGPGKPLISFIYHVGLIVVVPLPGDPLVNSRDSWPACLATLQRLCQLSAQTQATPLMPNYGNSNQWLLGTVWSSPRGGDLLCWVTCAFLALLVVHSLPTPTRGGTNQL